MYVQAQIKRLSAVTDNRTCSTGMGPRIRVTAILVA